uniref:CRISP toxin n=1 Tax=Heloderma suspectum cinctum TaxID=537493 RepID=C6EVG0_HELSC|nr:CRISP toxin [Heloderma suspectum cinctum]
MILLSLYLCLAAMLHQSEGEASPKLPGLMTSNPDQQTEITDKHNNLRRIVEPTASNMLKMTWSNKIAQNAQRSANQCTLEHTSKEERTIDGVECGENLFFSSAPYTWSYAIQNWFDERKYFRFNYGPTAQNVMIGHYTQVVWYRSHELGCAIAYCPHQATYKYYQVCQYCPGGNIRSRKYTPYSIGPPCGDCPDACDNGLCTNPCKQHDVYNNCPDLKKQVGCGHPIMKDCRATCECLTEIK